MQTAPNVARFGKARDHCPDAHPEKRRQVRSRKSGTTGSPIMSSLTDHPGLICARLLSKPVRDKREKLKYMKGRKRSQATDIRYQGTAAASSYFVIRNILQDRLTLCKTKD